MEKQNRTAEKVIITLKNEKEAREKQIRELTINLKNATKTSNRLLHEAEVKEHLLQRSYETQNEQRNEIEMLEETLGQLEESIEIITTQKEKLDLKIKDFQLSMSERDEKLVSSDKKVVQLQHEILLLNKIVDDTTNETKTLENLLQKSYHAEEQLYKEIQLIEDELTKSDVNIMMLTNENHNISEQLSVNKSPAVAREKQLINSRKIRSKLHIKVSSLHKMVGKSNMECLRQFAHLQHQLVDRDKVIKEMFIKMDTLKELVTQKRCFKLLGSRNDKLINEIENILTVQPGGKKPWSNLIY